MAPTTVSSSVRTREYLTTREIERLMAAARKSSRYGHRDATMILIGYRHGLRASELCDLQWSQVELTAGRLHVRRAKSGSPSVHPMQGDEIRALRRLQREQGPSSHVFMTERGGPMTPKAFHALFGRIGAWAKMPFPVHPHMLRHGCGYALGQCRPRHAGAAGLARAQEHPAHGALHRAGAGSVQGLLALIRLLIAAMPPVIGAKSDRRSQHACHQGSYRNGKMHHEQLVGGHASRTDQWSVVISVCSHCYSLYSSFDLSQGYIGRPLITTDH